MKPSLTFALVGCIAQLFVCASPAQGFDPTLYPAEYGKIILNIECTADSKLTWNSEVQAGLKGLKKGDHVLAITRDGAVVPARLGELECMTGECRGNYVSVDLVIGKGDDAIGAMRVGKESVPKEILLKPVTVDGKQCKDLYPVITHKRLPEIVSERECRKVTLPDGAELLLAKKGFQLSDDGWIEYVVKGQILRPGKAGKGPVFDVDQDTSPLEPLLGFMDDKGVSVFWRKASGISGPARITVRWSQLKESGALVFGQPSTAGGQPCD